MAISVQFQNLNQANTEILKAFNSANSAKALEAYQPLSAKDRKREKLKALQLLKQSSESETLQDISLNTSSLAVALQKAEGATLQAMLNLLSAKMIEQNKYTYIDTSKQIDLKKKVQEKLDEYKEEAKDEQAKQNKEEAKDKKKDQAKEEKKETAIDKLIQAAATYFKELQEDIMEQYSKFLSAVSLENLRKAFAEGLTMVMKYSYQVPAEAFSEYIIEPINDFRANLKSLLDEGLRTNIFAKSKKTFSHKEIRSMLQNSLDNSRDIKLERTVLALDRSLKARAQMQLAKKKFSHDEIKLALHTH